MSEFLKGLSTTTVAVQSKRFWVLPLAIFGVVLSGATAMAQECTAADLPAAERKQLESAYTARRLLHGRAKADAWAREEGLKSRAKLAATGLCGPKASGSKPAPKANKGQKKCRMVSRAISGPGGMTMAMVPKCD